MLPKFLARCKEDSHLSFQSCPKCFVRILVETASFLKSFALSSSKTSCENF